MHHVKTTSRHRLYPEEVQVEIRSDIKIEKERIQMPTHILLAIHSLPTHLESCRSQQPHRKNMVGLRNSANWEPLLLKASCIKSCANGCSLGITSQLTYANADVESVESKCCIHTCFVQEYNTIIFKLFSRRLNR